MMVAGRADCPAGFSLDYDGYLMAQAYNAKRTEHICVDDDAEGVTDSTANSHSAHLYPVETVGGLAPYTDNKEVTCAQCSSNTGPTYVRWGRRT